MIDHSLNQKPDFDPKEMKMRCLCHWLCALTVACSLTLGATSEARADSPTGWEIESELGIRAIPIGLQLATDAGYRVGLSDSDSLLLDGTYLEPGVTTTITPSNFWGGVYMEALPIALLQLRASAEFLGYFGNFGYLHLPRDEDQSDWTLDALDETEEMGLGQSATGVKFSGEATLRAKVGGVVALVPFEITRVQMDVDQAYYESSFDWLLEPTDTFWLVKPTLGYAFSFEKLDSWLLTGLRWEHSETFEQGFSRDLGTLLALWKLPGKWWPGKEMQLAMLGGAWINHPNRESTRFYFATAFSMKWLSPAVKAEKDPRPKTDETEPMD